MFFFVFALSVIVLWPNNWPSFAIQNIVIFAIDEANFFCFQNLYVISIQIDHFYLIAAAVAIAHFLYFCHTLLALFSTGCCYGCFDNVIFKKNHLCAWLQRSKLHWVWLLFMIYNICQFFLIFIYIFVILSILSHWYYVAQ